MLVVPEVTAVRRAPKCDIVLVEVLGIEPRSERVHCEGPSSSKLLYTPEGWGHTHCCGMVPFTINFRCDPVR